MSPIANRQIHKRKYLVVVDETAECKRAIFYAAHRAARNDNDIVMLAVVPPPDPQAWMGLDAKMRDEEKARAHKLMQNLTVYCQKLTGLTPEVLIQEGDKAQSIVNTISNDSSIAVLVLASGTSHEGPGPLVSHFVVKMAGAFTIPILIVPGNLTDMELKVLV